MNIKIETVYLPVTQGKTQRATATTIYRYLVDHPEAIPTGIEQDLVFRLTGSGDACVKFSDWNGLHLSAWPASATEAQAQHGKRATSGDSIGHGALISNPHIKTRYLDADENIHFIRLIVGRALRHHFKTLARTSATT